MRCETKIPSRVRVVAFFGPGEHWTSIVMTGPGNPGHLKNNPISESHDAVAVCFLLETHGYFMNSNKYETLELLYMINSNLFLYRLLSTRIMNIVDPIFHGYPKAPRRTPHLRRSSCSSQGCFGETCMNHLRL